MSPCHSTRLSAGLSDEKGKKKKKKKKTEGRLVYLHAKSRSAKNHDYAH